MSCSTETEDKVMDRLTKHSRDAAIIGLESLKKNFEGPTFALDSLVLWYKESYRLESEVALERLKRDLTSSTTKSIHGVL